MLHSQLFWVVFFAGLIVVPRSLSMLAAHSESNDDEYHLQRGLYMLCGVHDWAYQSNDPPLGEEIISLPMFLTRCVPTRPVHPENLPDRGLEVNAGYAPRLQPHRLAVLYGEWLSPEFIILMNAAWGSLLFLPFVGLCFHWCRELYGSAAGWLAAALVVFEPTIIAHVPVSALDVLAVEFMAFACWFTWRYTRKPTKLRLAWLAFFIAATMLVKHTAVITPVVAITMIVILRQRDSSKRGVDWSQHLALGIAAWACSIWALCNFDYSMPYDSSNRLLRLFGRYDGTLIDFVNDLLVRRWPAGTYIASFILALNHGTRGHWTLLFGEHRGYGWWYYFFAVATYKVPLGILFLLGLAVASLFWRKPRWEELSLLIPAVAWTVFISASPINIGFRHFLPPYTFMLLLAVRVVGVNGLWKAMGITGAAVAAISTIPYHPDYIAYLNWPRERAYLDISDSNVEWGQSVKQIRDWIATHPTRRQIWVRFGWSAAEPYYLDQFQVKHLDFYSPRPTTGLLIIRPVWVAGMYDPLDYYAALRNETPDAVIGHAILVYDLDRLALHGFRCWARVSSERRTDWHPKPSNLDPQN